MNAEFIYSHFDLTITEKVTMEEPVYPTSNGENLPEWFLEEEQKYNDHVATLRSFHYELTEVEHGKSKFEGIDFKVVRGEQKLFTDQQQWQEMSVQEKDGYFEMVAVPIVPVVKQDELYVEKYWEGFDFALGLLDEMYAKDHPHPYNISDCIKAKVNRLGKKYIRPNPIKEEIKR